MPGERFNGARCNYRAILAGVKNDLSETYEMIDARTGKDIALSKDSGRCYIRYLTLLLMDGWKFIIVSINED